MIRGDVAVLHYFSSVHHAGSQSVGNPHAVPDVVSFPDLAGGELTLPGSIVIDMVTGERSVHAFAEHLSRPGLADWLEL